MTKYANGILFTLCALICLVAVPAQAQEAMATPAVFHNTRAPNVRSGIALVYDEETHSAIYTKSADTVAPIASISKLMTAMVILDARLPMDEKITLTRQDEDHYKRSRSRMRRGMVVTRAELLKLALLASENRAAAALARTFPGGTRAAVEQMNRKARALGMNHTHFVDPTGLHSENVSTAGDLVKMVLAARSYPAIQDATTTGAHSVDVGNNRQMHFRNTNPLVRNARWEIGLSKTGYIAEAGRCLVMEARISDRPVVIVLLDSWGRRTRVGDANRVRHWMENAMARLALVRG
jgi:D-alanyl-D-alanine endopeptidase (penicillin-binding protein 7)